MPTRLHTSASQRCLKHIVPTFKPAAVFTSDMPAVTSKHSDQSNPIKQYSTSSQFLVLYFLIHVDGFFFFRFCLCPKFKENKQHELQPDEIYATIMLLKHSLLCLSQIIASVQMLLSYIT